MKYDVIIVGAGPAGLYGAYEYALKNPEFNVLGLKGHYYV